MLFFATLLCVLFKKNAAKINRNLRQTGVNEMKICCFQAVFSFASRLFLQTRDEIINPIS